jgi:hypothetical protein
MIYNRHSFLIASFLVAAVAAPAAADTLNGAGVFLSWGQPTLRDASNNPVYGGAFWNNKSGDGPTYGIGWCLTGFGACSVANPPGLLPFYADATGAALPNLSFTSASSSINVSLRGVFTSQTSAATGIDYIGYYTLDSSGHVNSATKLLGAGDALNTVKTFSLPAGTQYGFYLENVQGEGTVNETDYWFYLDSTQDTTNRGILLTALQHAAVFNQNLGLSYYLGFEDTISGVGDADYNDVIVQVTAVPEPASSALAFAGTAGLGLYLRRCRSSKHAYR